MCECVCLGPCPSTEYPTPSCSSTCDKQSTSKLSIGDDRKKNMFATSYDIGSSVSQIQTEIMTNGPVSAAFSVYSDFESYSTGVYKHETGTFLGGHAVKIIGWGTDPTGGDFWLVANSWNEDWGEKGFFRIARGSDECGIESQIAAGSYKYNPSSVFLRSMN